MNSTIPSDLAALLIQFRSCFTEPTFANFVTLVTGWMLCTGRHTISRMIQFGSGPARLKHHSTLYRFFSRAVWELDTLGHVLVETILPLIPGETILAIVDDTLVRRSGPHLWGGGMHRDEVGSTYGRGTSVGRVLRWAFGHNWVILSLWVPLPWNPERGMAVPVLFRLYRSKKRCPEAEYRKRTELAREMLLILFGWLPAWARLEVVGDGEYACQTVVRDLPGDVIFTGPMVMTAAFYDVPLPYPGNGRPRKKGKRLLSPRELLDDDSIPWRLEAVRLYSRDVELLVKSQVGLWYTVAGTTPVRMIVTRDPRGRFKDRAYFRTDPKAEVQEILTPICRRWSAEVMHRDVKQNLGLEDAQNGWWRRGHGEPAPEKRPGPEPDATRGKKAVTRTAPIGFITYSVVVVWYLRNANPKAEVGRVRKLAPWYRHKEAPSFADMLYAIRRSLWVARLSGTPGLRAVSEKVAEVLPEWLLAA